jgi:hypothetical protein
MTQIYKVKYREFSSRDKVIKDYINIRANDFFHCVEIIQKMIGSLTSKFEIISIESTEESDNESEISL